MIINILIIGGEGELDSWLVRDRWRDTLSDGLVLLADTLLTERGLTTSIKRFFNKSIIHNTNDDIICNVYNLLFCFPLTVISISPLWSNSNLVSVDNWDMSLVSSSQASSVSFSYSSNVFERALPSGVPTVTGWGLNGH